MARRGAAADMRSGSTPAPPLGAGAFIGNARLAFVATTPLELLASKGLHSPALGEIKDAILALPSPRGADESADAGVERPLRPGPPGAMRLLPPLIAAMLCAAPLAAQVRPKPGPDNPHIQSVEYAPGQVVLLEAAPGYQLTIELSADEQVENVAIGDSSAWQVTANRRGDHLFVKALSGGVSTNMSVTTNIRSYVFELTPASSGGEVPYTVRFHYPPAAAEEQNPQAAAEGRYRLGGDRALQPSEISDDGTHTYIRWPRDRSLPAVYGVTETGAETLVNGMMREDDVFVIDDIWQKLVFRIDRHKADATRERQRKRR